MSVAETLAPGVNTKRRFPGCPTDRGSGSRRRWLFWLPIRWPAGRILLSSLLHPVFAGGFEHASPKGVRRGSGGPASRTKRPFHALTVSFITFAKIISGSKMAD